jgi:hypothetical protein
MGMSRTCLESTGKARQIAERLLAMHAGAAAAPEPAAAAPPQRARPAIDYPRLQHHIRWFDGLFKLYRAMARAVAEQVVVDEPEDTAGAGGGAATAGGGPDPLIDIVRRAHRILLEHPIAAKAAYAALAEQGRAFAATSEGTELRERLVRSRRLRRASLVWRSLTQGMLDDQDPGELPATYLDNLLRVIDRADLEQLLGRLHLREAKR